MAEDDLFSWAERAPAPSPPAERSYGSGDKTHREKVLEVLSDGQWHTTRALMQVGGTRFGARVQELRDRGLTVDCRHRPDAPPGVFEWRLVREASALRQPQRRLGWKERALSAEARELELGARVTTLEAQLNGGK